jgi:hypothetical protein
MEQARIDANAAGASTYEGRPCRHGHGGLRYVASGGCVICAREAGAKYYHDRRETLRAGRGALAVTETPDTL